MLWKQFVTGSLNPAWRPRFPAKLNKLLQKELQVQTSRIGESIEGLYKACTGINSGNTHIYIYVYGYHIANPPGTNLKQAFWLDSDSSRALQPKKYKNNTKLNAPCSNSKKIQNNQNITKKKTTIQNFQN